MKQNELQLADQVVDDKLLGICTVQKLTETEITFFRPYTHTGDFSYTGGVICYVGIEEWTDDRNRNRDWKLITRKELR